MDAEKEYSQKDLMQGLYLHFFAHIAMADDADQLLATRKLGRIHHRILGLAYKFPGITVGELLTLLRVTHQNIQRPLRQLIVDKYLLVKISETDGRVKFLYASKKGGRLYESLTQAQWKRIREAFTKSGKAAVAGYLTVLENMIDDRDKPWAAKIAQK